MELLVVGALEKPETDQEIIKGGYPITFRYLGRKGYDLTLLADTAAAREVWQEKIVKQQEVMRERSMIFDTLRLVNGPSSEPTALLLSEARLRMARTTGYTLPTFEIGQDLRPPVHVLDLPEVTQVDVLDEYKLLVVLSGRSVMAIPLDALDMSDQRLA